VPSGSTVCVWEAPASGYTFSGWSYSPTSPATTQCPGITNPYYFTMPSSNVNEIAEYTSTT
jgi:hypothetical protein